ncbi:MAG: class I SAM-dependent methyltransferase [Mycoplasmataceae bacterium]|jgi:tRNA (adenine22-N1)-methyltransferase|nr:class I SAM-dependent methyltransferase [Mycoplasmataceae bacterium]
MLSNRLSAIIKRIKTKNNVIIDVGSDHSYIAINALLHANTKFVYNIEKNTAPMQQGIKNLTRVNLLNKTENIIADGLYINKINKKINYCIISGLGGNTIVNILSNSIVKNIKEYILVANDHPEKIRTYLRNTNQKISYEEMILENNIYYSLIQVSPKGKKIKNIKEILFGPINIKKETQIFKNYLKFLHIKYTKLLKLSNKEEHSIFLNEINSLL